MLRSLYSSISGLQNHQVRMDLIGNNIANVNTTGYKSQRLTFEESFSQMLAGSSRPPGENGGTNPVQVGLGSSIGSIDTVLTQGNIQSTGQATDIAIEGNAYFAVSDGNGTYYTRNGAFQMDSSGHLVLPTNGMVLQGKLADKDGTFPPGSMIGDVRVPFDEQAPARETEKVNFSRNLNADSQAQGTIAYTQVYNKDVGTADSLGAMPSPTLTSLKNSKGESLNLKPGDRITVSVGGAGAQKMIVTVTDGAPASNITGATPEVGGVAQNPPDIYVKDLSDLVAAINTVSGSASLITRNGTAADAHAGQILIGAGVQDLQVTTEAPLAKGYLAGVFSFPALTGTSGTPPVPDTYTDRILTGAKKEDYIRDLYDANGNNIGRRYNTALPGYEDAGLGTNDLIQVSATVGNEPSTPGTLTYDESTTTLQNVIDLVRETLRLPLQTSQLTGAPESVTMNDPDSDDNLPDGALVVRGQPGIDFGISGLVINAKDNTGTNGVSPKYFNQNNSTTDFQKARDLGVVDTSITVYDKNGSTHNLTMTFVPSNTEGEWEWSAHFPGTEQVQSGGKGKISFGLDGSVSSFSYDDGASRLRVDPGNGAELMEIELDVGGPGDFQGLTQFKSPSTASAVKQDGYGTGQLSDISVDTYGYVKGVFTNGVSKDLAQIMLVDFVNPGGLQKLSDSVYTTSSNSGDPVYGSPGVQSTSKLRPGALEGSNVEMSREFTDMITTQRGFQANSRVITVSDQMLEELTGLKR